uniref:Small ribosomal subunit protein uS3c n=1 Tax=Johansenicoccus eremophilus TaxID=3068301 RepID=A0AA49LPD0_9CHLO|nr:ribosomal protein S3 [Chlorophyceae sp. KF-2023a]
MGQKVHPLGFRVGITKKYSSSWFARFSQNEYSQALLEDNMIRRTLTKLLPDLVSQVSKNRDNKFDREDAPKLSHIKIERGLIPYEIGIQIHAGNCEAFKAAMSNVSFLRTNNEKKSNTISDLRQKAGESNAIAKYTGSNKYVDLKTQKHLLRLKTKLSEGSLSPGPLVGQNITTGSTPSKKDQTSLKNSRLSESEGQRKVSSRIEQRRLKKRKIIRQRFQKSLSRRMLIVKKGDLLSRHFLTVGASTPSDAMASAVTDVKTKKYPYSLVQRRFTLNRSKTGFINKSSFSNTSGIGQRGEAKSLNTKSQGYLAKSSGDSKLTPSKLNADKTLAGGKAPAKVQLWSKNKLAETYLSAGEKAFKKKLRAELVLLNTKPEWNFSLRSPDSAKNDGESLDKNLKTFAGAPLGYRRALGSKVLNALSLKSLSKRTESIKILGSKAIKMTDALKKEYYSTGSLSNASVFEYYGLISLLKRLKASYLDSKRQRKDARLKEGAKRRRDLFSLSLLRQQKAKDKNGKGAYSKSNDNALYTNSINKNLDTAGAFAPAKVNIYKFKAENIDAEFRKVRFVEYLQSAVQRYRTNNLFLYLSTIAESRKKILELNSFVRQNSGFLIGINLASLSSPAERLGETADLKEQIRSKVYGLVKNQNKKLESEKALREVFMSEYMKSRRMHLDNTKLIPKISIKFYSVNEQQLKTSASLVADTIVDDLEKRKAFRGVIKKAKEDLMSLKGVKGVKIKVGGRLNGAEIARSEWVRAGRVPLQTLRANIDYAYKTASTIYGIIGVKVWIYKGSVQVNKNKHTTNKRLLLSNQ